ncbi:LysR family transcriptional regulator [Aquirhabdus parva]|uniref:LysR family transcriptional regulator n=1 Tax=Aquirhabdus parva TaxID=2283318 RepID=A0A345PB77_9GAMM|nr:LysR family transcriptional regulator [Aquirhabdus parva]AXI04536.1 LysR family transcriptional regulator [Aquirhabdus parva]
MDQLQAMQVFVRVCESGSFTHASDVLGISRAAASNAIQQLEGQLQTRLLNRTTRHVQLTADGQTYFERCIRLLADFAETQVLFQQSDQKPRGKLRVDVPSRIARCVIVPALPDFFERYPDIELQLDVTDRQIDLFREGVDCVVRGGQSQDHNLISVNLGMLAQSNCASPSYIDHYGLPLAIEDLEKHWMVSYASPLTGQVYDWEYQRNGILKTINMKSRLTVNNVEAYIASAIAGLGLIQIPSYDVAAEIKQGMLMPVLLDYPPDQLQLNILYPRWRQLSQPVQVFTAWMREQFASRMV